ncbi:ABC transporter permease [Lactococcus cremoris]|uniref:ABC transporter permease n=1 Tax=Lactococcus lactis subsp. cremoris TaxID=1359 RepID=UPI0003ABC81F|nr:ABC transporter permease [Lactococcus cremoris]AGV72861.1 teichoic acid ABC transporter permease protein TagH [Lactococcus cremoris subsp. cremoris KW2]
MKDLIQYLKEQIDNLGLIHNVSKYHTKATALGNTFGTLWEYIDPVVRSGIYYFVFIVMFKRTVADGIPPAPWLVIGLGVWFFYSTAILSGARSIQLQISLFTQVKFPVSVLPTIEMFKGFSTLFGMGIVGTLIAIFKFGYYPSIYYLQIPYYVLALFLVTLAFSLLFSTVVVVFRDFSHVIDYIFRFALYLSGGAIDLTIMGALPLPIRQALLLDPFIYCMEGIRDAVFGREWFWQKPGLTLVFWCFTIGLLAVGAHLHMKLRNQFMDYV